MVSEAQYSPHKRHSFCLSLDPPLFSSGAFPTWFTELLWAWGSPSPLSGWHPSKGWRPPFSSLCDFAWRLRRKGASLRRFLDLALPALRRSPRRFSMSFFFHQISFTSKCWWTSLSQLGPPFELREALQPGFLVRQFSPLLFPRDHGKSSQLEQPDSCLLCRCALFSCRTGCFHFFFKPPPLSGV